MLEQISIPEINREKLEELRDIVLKQCDRAYDLMTGNCRDYYNPSAIKPCEVDYNEFTPEELEQALEYEKLSAQLEILNKIAYNRFYYEPLDYKCAECGEAFEELVTVCEGKQFCSWSCKAIHFQEIEY